MRRLLHAGSVGALVVLGAGLELALAAGVAGADPGPSYALQASGQALKITVGGTSLVGGSSTASAGIAQAPMATGAGELSPVLTSSQTASASSPSASQVLQPTCAASPPGSFPPPFSSILNVGVACGSASASQDPDGYPSATATGQVVSLSVSPSASALPVPVSPGSTLSNTLQTLFGSLPPVPVAGSTLMAVLQGVAAAANVNWSSLVSASLGTSTSTVTANSASASATVIDAGDTIDLLTGLGSGGGPLLTVAVGQAEATASADRASGNVTAADTPATVSVTLSPPVGSPQTVSVAPGQSQTFLSGTPLQTTISVGSGTAHSGQGSGSASAAGLTIDALQGVGASSAAATDGGIDIELATAAASVTAGSPATVAAASVPPPPAVVPGVTTVHTGEPWAGPLPIALLGLGMLSGLALVVRGRLSSMTSLLHHLARRATTASGQPPGPATGTSSVPPPVSGPARRLPD
jgi:hypothetical protein